MTLLELVMQWESLETHVTAKKAAKALRLIAEELENDTEMLDRMPEILDLLMAASIFESDDIFGIRGMRL